MALPISSLLFLVIGGVENYSEVIFTKHHWEEAAKTGHQDGQTPLMECSVKNLEMTMLMLDFGAETNSRDLQDSS